MADYHFPDLRILVMARAPLAGQAKTRLIPALGAAGAAQLHRQLVLRLLDALDGARVAPVQLWCSPDRRDPFFQYCQQHYSLSLHDQQGADLGARMGHALTTALQEAQGALVVGCDIPGLDGDYLHQACLALEAGEDAVLGPSEDGGYTLLGLKRMANELFEQMPWGSDRVLGETRSRLRSLGWHWQELATLWDLDRPEDLARWQRAE